MMPVASPNTRDDQLLVRYLVGALPPDETERLDELSISDDRFAADLRAAEHDLVDAYVRGALAGDLLRQFEMHYLGSPNAAMRVSFARTLLEHERRAPTSKAGLWRAAGLLQPMLAAAA